MNIRHITHSWIKGLALTLLVISLAPSTAWPIDDPIQATGDENQPEEDYQWRFVLADTGGSRFEQTCGNWSDSKYEVTRVCVEPPNYDGPPGYTAILIRSFLASGPGIRTEILTTLATGQYWLHMFEPEGFKIYAYELEQRGAGLYITGLRVFSPDKPDGERVGPRGFYQYASCNPAGTCCLLVDSSITVYEFETGITTVLHTAAIPLGAANPKGMVGDVNLSGECMKMEWTSDKTGTFTIRNEEGHLQMLMDLDLEPILAK